MNDRTVFNALIKEKSDTFNIMFAAAIAILFLINIGGFCLPYIHMNAIEGSITPYICDAVFAISMILATIVFFTNKRRHLASDKKLQDYLLKSAREAMRAVIEEKVPS
jgi:hypothetical protein